MKREESKGESDTAAESQERTFVEGKEAPGGFERKNAIRRINLDVPEWALQALDTEAARRGITRQALIKTWLIDRLDMMIEKQSA